MENDLLRREASTLEADKSDDARSKMIATLMWFTRMAMKDPDFARVQGIQPVGAMPLFAAADNRAGGFTHADWLRGAVHTVLPSYWRYELHEGADGQGHLTLTARDP